jgi:hypothetical protein
MGEPGWKGLIPIYADFKLYDKAWSRYAYYILVIFALIGIGTSAQGEQGLSMSLTEILQSADMTVAMVASLVAAVASFIIEAIFYIKLSKAFGKGVGVGIGLIFLTPIFVAYLAFSDAEYLEPDRRY